MIILPLVLYLIGVIQTYKSCETVFYSPKMTNGHKIIFSIFWPIGCSTYFILDLMDWLTTIPN